jgi:predicted PolB exonuclease-like 3'-5' exonuclease
MYIYFDIETVRDEAILSRYNIEKMRAKYWEKLDFAPEMTKIVTITMWTRTKEWIAVKNLEWDEKEQIQKFFEAIKWHTLVWFNIKSFDIPFIIKRALHFWISIPGELKMFGKKPWEMENIIDLLDVYKYWVFWAIWNLDLICNFLWITSPKDDNIDWWQVQRYFDEWKIDEILAYCKRDVQATIELHEYFKLYNLV